MLELDNRITRLEIVSEQLRLHLRSLPRETVERRRCAPTCSRCCRTSFT